MGASRRALALACVSCACMISGAAYAGLPSGPAPALADSISLPRAAPVTTPAVTDSAPSLPVSYGEPRPHLVPAMIDTHAVHQHHMAVVAAAAAPPAPVPSHTAPAVVALPSTTAPAQTPAPVATVNTTPTAQTPAGTGDGTGAGLLAKALTMQGVPYVYGGDTPGGFDCSGLVYWAALQLGVSSMPRDTYSMLAQGVSSGLLVQVSEPSYGDLAFFGSGHVEFYVHAGETFGAQSPGTVVGYHPYGGGYAPSAFYRVT